ncbi:MAG: porin [Rubrivivax sp.]
MKKSLLALAALTAFAGVASAQSSVTLFGVIDANVRNVKTSGGSLKTLSTDGMGSSRLGVRGVEDIGGGLRAGFWLEGSVNVDVGGGQKAPYAGITLPAGTSSAIGNTYSGMDWQRRATVSLLGGFGEIRLGRDYTPDFWNHTIFDPFGTNGVGNSVNTFTTLGSGASTTVRANNSVGYFLPGGLGGVYGQGMFAFGEGASGNKHMGARVGYAAGPLNVAVAYGKTSVTEGPPAVSWKRFNVGASYNLGFMTLMGQYIKSDVSGGAANGRGNTNIVVGANIKAGAQGTFKVSYVKADGDGPAATDKTRDATQMAFGYQHALSKRSSVYAHYGRISNESGANYRVSGTSLANASGKASTGYEFGVNHSF